MQKSVYFGRTADPNSCDLDLIRRLAVVGAKAGGVGGPDEDNVVKMSVLSFCVSRKGSDSTRDTVVYGGTAVRDRVSASQGRATFLMILIFSSLLSRVSWADSGVGGGGDAGSLTPRCSAISQLVA